MILVISTTSFKLTLDGVTVYASGSESDVATVSDERVNWLIAHSATIDAAIAGTP